MGRGDAPTAGRQCLECYLTLHNLKVSDSVLGFKPLWNKVLDVSELWPKVTAF